MLSFIAVELFLLRRDILWIARFVGKDSEDQRAKGQTINVNIGTPAQPGAAADADGKPAELLPESTEKEDPSPEEEAARAEEERLEEERRREEAERQQRAAERARMEAAVPRPTASGLMVKKCPNCGMDNTTYRTECFNCGSPL